MSWWNFIPSEVKRGWITAIWTNCLHILAPPCVKGFSFSQNISPKYTPRFIHPPVVCMCVQLPLVLSSDTVHSVDEGKRLLYFPIKYSTNIPQRDVSNRQRLHANFGGRVGGLFSDSRPEGGKSTGNADCKCRVYIVYRIYCLVCLRVHVICFVPDIKHVKLISLSCNSLNHKGILNWVFVFWKVSKFSSHVSASQLETDAEIGFICARVLSFCFSFLPSFNRAKLDGLN